jgi:predicted ribosome quality control (RQC) complex YloA/Tae2 family protein
MDILGRSRKIQMELAEKWGIKDYPSPAGGCKLTEPNYSKRLKGLLEHKELPNENDLELLKFGRHFRVSKEAKIISTRTGEEAKEIKNYLTDKDIIFLADEFKGSMVIIVGEPAKEDIDFAAKITARYCKGKDEEKIRVKYGYFKSPMDKFIEVNAATDDEISKYLI